MSRGSKYTETMIRPSSAKLSTYVHGFRGWILMKTVTVRRAVCLFSSPGSSSPVSLLFFGGNARKETWARVFFFLTIHEMPWGPLDRVFVWICMKCRGMFAFVAWFVWSGSDRRSGKRSLGCSFLAADCFCSLLINGSSPCCLIPHSRHTRRRPNKLLCDLNTKLWLQVNIFTKWELVSALCRVYACFFYFFFCFWALNSRWALKVIDKQVMLFKKNTMETSVKQTDVLLCGEARGCFSSAHFRKAPFLTVELKRRWQMLQEMICFFLKGWGTPNVWLITAFWTGSIWETAKDT